MDKCDICGRDKRYHLGVCMGCGDVIHGNPVTFSVDNLHFHDSDCFIVWVKGEEYLKKKKEQDEHRAWLQWKEEQEKEKRD